MSDWEDWGFDQDDDPYQSGLQMFGNYGISMKPGPVLGVVLSVHAADSEQNLLLRSVRGSSDTSKKAAYAEADVLVLQSHYEENFILPHCLIAQMKSSRLGPAEDEPADYSEDLPNGCTAAELDALYDVSNSAQSFSAADLSGDWVYVDFLGGVLQMPVIRGWFSNPFNLSDAATSQEKKRFKFRRNNSGYTVEPNGDFHWYHRAGQYIQFKNKGITIKQVGGSVIHMAENGSVSIVGQDGKSILMDEDGIYATTASSSLELKSSGGANIFCGAGDINLSTSGQVNLIGQKVVATDGKSGGSSLAKASTFGAAKVAIDTVKTLLDALEAIATVPPLAPLLPMLQAIKAPLDVVSKDMEQSPEKYQTSILRGE